MDHQDPQVQQDLTDSRELAEPQDLQDHLVVLDLLDHPARLAHKVLQEEQVPSVVLDQLDHRDQADLQAVQELLVLQDL